MPIYEYRCASCSHQFEMIQGASEKEKITCPKCGSRAERVLSTFSCGGGKESASTPASGCAPKPGRFS